MPPQDLPVEVPECVHADATIPKGLFDTIFTIQVVKADRERDFHVHRGLLCHHSKFFKDNLQDHEDVFLLYEEPYIVDTAVYWLYTSKFSPPGSDGDGRIATTWFNLIRLYEFADQLIIPELKNACVTLFFQKCAQDATFPVTFIAPLYERTMPGSTLRKLMVNYFVHAYNFRVLGVNQMGIAFPHQFLIDVLLACMELHKVPGEVTPKALWIQEEKRDFCRKYHNHNNN